MSARTQVEPIELGRVKVRILTEDEARERFAHAQLVVPPKAHVRVLRAAGRTTGRLARVGLKVAAVAAVYTGIGVWRTARWLVGTRAGRRTLAALVVGAGVAVAAVLVVQAVAWLVAHLPLVLAAAAGVLVLLALTSGGGGGRSGTFEFRGTGTWRAR